MVKSLLSYPLKDFKDYCEMLGLDQSEIEYLYNKKLKQFVKQQLDDKRERKEF